MNEFGHVTKPPIFARQYYYLASPYSNELESVREERAIAACKTMVWLTGQNYLMFSPILQGHAMWHEKPSLPYTYEHWKTVDEIFIEKSAGIIIACLEGYLSWRQSKGIQSEVKFAEKRKLPVYKVWLNPKTGSFSFVD